MLKPSFVVVKRADLNTLRDPEVLNGLLAEARDE